MKKALLVLTLAVFVATGAFAQIVLGITGVQYYEEVNGKLPTVKEAWADFKEGTGVFWGGYGEIVLGKLGLGLSFNQQTFKDEFERALDTWNYDVNFFLSYHLFGGRALLDPFLQAGVGMMAFDYKDKEAARAFYTLTDDPLFASSYFDFGLGLGINLGGIGIFGKGMWNVQSDEPLYSQEDGGTPIFSWPILPFKWVFGVKLIL
ncbi:MAG TPA: hypothetical protein DCG47_04920 [Spirochaetaceae bacterium]|nr:hypothetical protein [Spirochaetaceae bacterium]